MVTLRNILEEKDRHVWQISPDAAVYDALMLMGEKNIGALLVMVDDKIVGIVSERDYARKVILKGKNSKDTKVHDIMTAKVHTIDSEQTVLECMHRMSDLHIRHLPVMEDGKLTGVISIGDVVKAVMADQQETIDMLKNYISGHT